MKTKMQIRIGILIPILFIFQNLNSIIMSQSPEDKYEVMFFVTDEYCLTCNYQLLKYFQFDMKQNNLNYSWNIVNSNPKRFEYLKNKGEFNGLDNVFLDSANKTANLYLLKNFPIIILLKNDEIIYKSHNFVFEYTKEVADFDKNTNLISLDSMILDINKMIIVGDTKYIVDGIKQAIFRVKDNKCEELKIKEVIERDFDLKVFGDIKNYQIHILNDKPVALLRFNTLKEGGKTSYYEMIINLDDLKVIDYKYEKRTYIMSDNLLSICNDDLTYTCFHFDYYEAIDEDTIKKQPILATISKNNKVKYNGTIGEIEGIIQNEFRYLYVLNSFAIENNIILFEPTHGLAIYSKYNCETNSIDKFKQFDFENHEFKKMFDDIKLEEPYGDDLTDNSVYYFEGMKNVEKGNFAFVFRSKFKNDENIIEYIIFEFSESLHFQRKKTFTILENDENDNIKKTFFIPNSQNKIMIGIVTQNQIFKIYEPKL